MHPSWIVECLNAAKMLDCSKFLLYTNQRKNQPPIPFEKLVQPPRQISGEGTSTSTCKENEMLPSKSDELENSMSFPAKKNLDAKDKQFLTEFYNNSRLHLISTMKANFKNYVSQLRESKNNSTDFPERKKLPCFQKQMSVHEKGGPPKVIMHIDMDCFFVSVSIRKFPHLRGKPVAVAHAKGNSNEDSGRGNKISWSEIASCSYEARSMGIKNGMFVGPAKQLCPELQIIPYDFHGYQSVAQVLYDTVAKYTVDIQAVSCDEMLVDLSTLLTEMNNLDVLKFCENLRTEIYDATKCTASVGLGPNVLLSKLATKKAKPNGVYLLEGTCSSRARNFG